MSATEILHLVIRIADAGNLAEYLYDTEDNVLAARIRKAGELGFYTISDEGHISLTVKGSEYLAAVA